MFCSNLVSGNFCLGIGVVLGTVGAFPPLRFIQPALNVNEDPPSQPPVLALCRLSVPSLLIPTNF